VKRFRLQNSLIVCRSIGSLIFLMTAVAATDDTSSIGREVAIPTHLQDGEELQVPLPYLLRYGRRVFLANWTIQEGQGRPKLKGTGQPLSDPTSPLIFPRNMNRLSGPDANSCAGCHNNPATGCRKRAFVVARNNFTSNLIVWCRSVGRRDGSC
jgi:hypothetical protein